MKRKPLSGYCDRLAKAETEELLRLQSLCERYKTLAQERQVALSSLKMAIQDIHRRSASMEPTEKLTYLEMRLQELA